MKKKGWLGFLALMMLLFVLSCTASAATPVAANGRLKVSGTKIVNASGKPFQIKGVSTHGLSWFPEYANKAAMQELRDSWGVNTIRLAMYTEEYNGYCVGGAANQKALKQKIDECVKAAYSLGMYVIIDWHVLNDRNPNNHKLEAFQFFAEISNAYKNYPNVLYEICNEPNGGTSWAEIRSYADTLIRGIRKRDKNAIIIVGTPTWSQDVDVAAQNKLNYSNVVYALHFYANTHGQSYRDKAQSAIRAGLPILVSEFSICSADGNGGINTNEGNQWISFLDKNGIGYVAWSLCNKAETASLIKSSCSKTSGWTWNDLSQTGQWLVQTYKGKLANGSAGGTTGGSTGGTTGGTTGGSTGGTTGGNTGGTGNTAPGTSPGVWASAKNCKLSIRRGGYWKEGNLYYSNIIVSIRNTTNSPVSGWKILVGFKNPLIVSNFWNGKLRYAGRYVALQYETWNKEISPKATIEIGFTAYGKNGYPTANSLILQ